MKLIQCSYCQDVVALRRSHRTCWCGKSGGKYKDDDLHAYIEGPCTPLGFANSSFEDAIDNQPIDGIGKNFVAFVIPKVCPTIEVRAS